MLYYTVCTIEIIVYDQKWIIMEDMGVKSQVIHIFGKISNFAVILCGAWKIILRSGCTGLNLYYLSRGGIIGTDI